MKTLEAAHFVYIASILFSAICSIFRYKQIDFASKILSVLVCCAFVCECVAYFLATKFHNNLGLYAVYCLIEFSLLSLYFNNVIDVFTENKIGIYICIVGNMLGIVNIVFYQPLGSYNSDFLFFEDLAVMAMSLFALFRLLLKSDTLNLFRYPHFWFICVLIFFWSITFLNWGLYDYFNLLLGRKAWTIDFSLMLIGIVTYSSFGFVFLLYPKIKN